MNKKIDFPEIFFCALACVSVSLFHVFFLFLRNAREIPFRTIIGPALIFLAVMAILFLGCLLYFRSAAKAALIACVCYLILVNYIYAEKVIRKLIPSLRYYQVVILVLLGVFFLFRIAKKYLSADFSSFFIRVLAVLFLLIPAFELFNNRGDIFGQGGKLSTLPAADTADPSDAGQADLPNFYYLVFDEYAGFRQIKNLFGYDNTPFADRLTELGFTVSFNGHNESTHTAVICTNIMNLAYTVEYENVNDSSHYRENVVFPLLRSNGYTLVGGPGSDFYGLEPPVGKSGSGPETIDGKSVMDLLLESTPLYPFVQVDKDRTAKDVKDSFDWLKHPEGIPSHNAFVLAHVNAPHIPYVFRADGTLNTYQDFFAADRPEVYLQYHQYVTGQILEIAEALTTADPNAVIVLSSDHGFRAGASPREEKINFFNAVYFGGEPFAETADQSAVNTLRLILNRLLGTDYELVEVPDYENEAE